ncbi:MAG: pseudouridine synthase [Nitrospiraceae bacterium]
MVTRWCGDRARQRGGLHRHHKPAGVTTTSEPDVRRNIIAEINHPARIFPIGRLDKDSTGLILLTNDGNIANEILRVEHGHEREYRGGGSRIRPGVSRPHGGRGDDSRRDDEALHGDQVGYTRTFPDHPGRNCRSGA